MAKFWTVTKKLFNWDELDAEAKATALASFREDDLADWGRFEAIENQVKEVLHFLGFDVRSLDFNATDWSHHMYFEWEGGYGDGVKPPTVGVIDAPAEWSEDVTTLHNRLTALQAEYNNKIYVWGRFPEGPFEISRSDDEYIRIFKVSNEFENAFKMVAKWAMTVLMQEDEYLLSEERAVETFQDQGTLFFVDGTIAGYWEEDMEGELTDAEDD